MKAKMKKKYVFVAVVFDIIIISTAKNLRKLPEQEYEFGKYKGEYVDYTNWTESDLNMNFLNKHHIKCKNNYILRGFTMEFNRFDDIDKVRFRFNCYPIDNSIETKCLNDSLYSTGWKKNNKSSIESLIEHKIDSHCENCLINSFKIDMKYSENIQNYLNQEWVNNFNFGWCIIREELQ